MIVYDMLNYSYCVYIIYKCRYYIVVLLHSIGSHTKVYIKYWCCHVCYSTIIIIRMNDYIYVYNNNNNNINYSTYILCYYIMNYNIYGVPLTNRAHFVSVCDNFFVFFSIILKTHITIYLLHNYYIL